VTKDKALARQAPAVPPEVRDFFSQFDDGQEPTVERIREVVDQVHAVGRMVGVIQTEFVVQAGRRLLWLKRVTGHGSWGALLKAYFPNLPLRTAQWWMAEARYFLEHGHRKNERVALLGAGVRAFDEDEVEELDADDLADPKKPAPRPRKELEADVGRLERRLAARDKREESLLKRIDDLEVRRDRDAKARDPDEAGGNPIREAMAKAVLSAGRAVVVLREADKEDLVQELRDGAAASLSSRLQSAAQGVANELYKVFHKAFPGKPWKGPEPSEE